VQEAHHTTVRLQTRHIPVQTARSRQAMPSTACPSRMSVSVTGRFTPATSRHRGY
jgi:hypothetical protein